MAFCSPDDNDRYRPGYLRHTTPGLQDFHVHHHRKVLRQGRVRPKLAGQVPAPSREGSD